MTFLKFTPAVVVFALHITTAKPAPYGNNELPASAGYTLSRLPIPTNRLLESLPEPLAIALGKRTRDLASIRKPNEVLSSLVESAKRWNPSSTVTVAFYGGDTDLHHDIEQATQQLTQYCNLKLDFGYNKNTDSYRTWSPLDHDRKYKAYIRVSFDDEGYLGWSRKNGQREVLTSTAHD